MGKDGFLDKRDGEGHRKDLWKFPILHLLIKIGNKIALDSIFFHNAIIAKIYLSSKIYLRVV